MCSTAQMASLATDLQALKDLKAVGELDEVQFQNAKAAAIAKFNAPAGLRYKKEKRQEISE
jgi:hypothetical protein